MGSVSRIDYSIFMALCDNSVSYGEVIEAIHFAEACEAEELRTYSIVEANDIIKTLN